MKKLSFSLSALGLFGYLILMTNCNPKTKTIDNPVQFDTIQVNESYYINNDTTSPGCNIRIEFVYPDSIKNMKNIRNVQNVFLEKILGESFKDKNPELVIQEFTSQYKEDFNKFVSHTNDSEYGEDENIYDDETGYSYYIHLHDNILYNKDNFISFTVENLSYEGGAHNSKSVYGYVYNLNTNKMLGENDFAGSKYMENISALLAEKIAEANGVKNIKDLENLGYSSVSDIKPNNNFTLDEKGITYYFNENEIAGTMVGITRVFIPYEELSVYIQKESPISVLTSF